MLYEKNHRGSAVYNIFSSSIPLNPKKKTTILIGFCILWLVGELPQWPIIQKASKSTADRCEVCPRSTEERACQQMSANESFGPKMVGFDLGEVEL